MTRILCFIGVLLLAACSSTQSDHKRRGYDAGNVPAIYTVKKGDTLFRISWRFGLNQAAVMQKNHIRNANKIYIGQRLRLTGTSPVPLTHLSPGSSIKPIVKYGDWVWPMKGTIIKRFNPGKIGANGIRIAGVANQTVNAADSGTVAYTGNGLNGYGNVIIIKHKDGLLSAYGFLSQTFVKEGQKISKRQKIGTVGYAANNRLMLHFEVRKNGQPINPEHYIGSHYHF